MKDLEVDRFRREKTIAGKSYLCNNVLPVIRCRFTRSSLITQSGPPVWHIAAQVFSKSAEHGHFEPLTPAIAIICMSHASVEQGWDKLGHGSALPFAKPLVQLILVGASFFRLPCPLIWRFPATRSAW